MILVRAETTPEDIHGMEVAAGILTSRGGMTSHAAVVTRGMGKCCVAGAGEIEVNEKTREMRAKGQVFKGRRLDFSRWHHRPRHQGQARAPRPASADDPELRKLMSWSEPFRKMGVRANADIPRDAIQARAFGAEGIGLCRTEHMFFGEDRLPHMRAMILASNEKGPPRRAARSCLPLQRADFIGVFRAMDGFPVTIRTLDPPLHEFLPRREDLMVEIAVLEATKPKSPKLKELRTHAAPGGGAARDQSHARPSRLPSRHHLSGDHRDAGTRHLRGRRGSGEGRRQGHARSHDPAECAR